MKIPKSFNRWSHDEKSNWVRQELKKVRKEEAELLKISRGLSSVKNFTAVMQEDDRPDLMLMK
jgi:hypothetical protein